MSLELDTRVWLAAREASFGDQFTELLNVIQPHLLADQTWQHLVIRKLVPGNEVFETRDLKDIQNLSSAFPEIQTADDLKVTAYASFPCWRFSQGQATKEGVMLGVTLTGPKYGSSIGLDPKMEGDVHLTFLNAGPFFGVLGADGEFDTNHPHHREMEENASSIIDLFIELSQKLPVRKMMTWTDTGPAYVPSNAHLAFFADAEILATSLREFKQLLRKGNMNDHVPSILAEQTPPDSWCAHSMRSKENEQDLAKRLYYAAKSEADVVDHAYRVLKHSGKYDMLENGEQFFVLEYPFFANAFLDDFFASGLEA